MFAEGDLSLFYFVDVLITPEHEMLYFVSFFLILNIQLTTVTTVHSKNSTPDSIRLLRKRRQVMRLHCEAHFLLENSLACTNML